MLQRLYVVHLSPSLVERAASCRPRPVPAATTAPPPTIQAAVRAPEPDAAPLSGCCSTMFVADGMDIAVGAAGLAETGVDGGGTTTAGSADAGFSVALRF